MRKIIVLLMAMTLVACFALPAIASPPRGAPPLEAVLSGAASIYPSPLLGVHKEAIIGTAAPPGRGVLFVEPATGRPVQSASYRHRPPAFMSVSFKAGGRRCCMAVGTAYRDAGSTPATDYQGGSMESTFRDSGSEGTAVPREDIYPGSLAKVLSVLDAGDPWDVAAAITVRSAYNDERRLRIRFERGAYQLQETLERIRDLQLPAFVERILDRLGGAELQIPPAGSDDRAALVKRLVDELIASAR